MHRHHALPLFFAAFITTQCGTDGATERRPYHPASQEQSSDAQPGISSNSATTEPGATNEAQDSGANAEQQNNTTVAETESNQDPVFRRRSSSNQGNNTPSTQTPAQPMELEEPALDPAANGDPNVVVFRIADGTGTAPWNDEMTTINAEVGQTIRFVNEDTVSHRLHTNGSPCPHGTNIPPGTTYDCVATRTYNVDNQGPLYNHNVNESAEVWLNVMQP